MQTHVPNKITVHCAASPNGKKVPIENIRYDHIHNRGFEDIGYHVVIQPDGQVDLGRPFNFVGAHVEGHNVGNLGIMLIGTDKFTRAQFDALRRTIDGILMTYSIRKSEIYCHNQFDTAQKQGKTCPNIPINVLLCWYHEIVGEQAIAPYVLA